MAKTIKQLIKAYTDIYYMEDTRVIPLVAAVILSNRMGGDPIWLMVIGGSSSGKTEIVNAVTGLNFVFQVSTLTPNTLLSGMRKGKNGKETSLLLRIPRTAVMVMKDFTSILSMAKDDQQEIMGQFREVFDGKMIKETGNGEPLSWEGKINLLAGVTEKLYVMEQRFSSMGTRALNYVLPEQDRVKTTKRASKISSKIKEHRENIKNEFTEYIEHMIPVVVDDKYELDELIADKLINVCNFASMARSPVERDYRGELDLVLSPEMPMRMYTQLQTLAVVFMAMEDGILAPEYESVLYKIAFDSIPKGRRLALRELAKYDDITSKGLAMKLNYPTDRVKVWLEELNALGICDRDVVKGKRGDSWKINEKYKDIIQYFDGVVAENGSLVSEEEEIEDSDLNLAADELKKTDLKDDTDWGDWANV